MRNKYVLDALIILILVIGALFLCSFLVIGGCQVGLIGAC